MIAKEGQELHEMGSKRKHLIPSVAYESLYWNRVYPARGFYHYLHFRKKSAS